MLLAGTERCATLAVPLSDPDKARDPNVVKVVRARSGHAMYFSREAIPHLQNGARGFARLRHVGVYGFDRDTLLRTRDLPSSGLDEAENRAAEVVGERHRDRSARRTWRTVGHRDQERLRSIRR